nr:unnamed protein product [Naegleria fowleri]
MPKKPSSSKSKKSTKSSQHKQQPQPLSDKQRSDQERERGNEQFRQQQFDAAITSYTQAILLDSNNVLNVSNRAQVFYKIGQYRNAINDAETALQLDPKWWKAYHVKAASLAALQEYEEAKHCCDQGLSALQSSSNNGEDASLSSSKVEQGIEMITNLKNQIESMQEKSKTRQQQTPSKPVSKNKELEQVKKKMDSFTLPQLFVSINNNDFEDVTKCLTDLGYSVNMPLNFEFGFGTSVTPLHYCVLKGTPDMLKYLLEKGADWKAKTSQPFYFTVLHLCCLFNVADMLQVLLNFIDEQLEKDEKQTS